MIFFRPSISQTTLRIWLGWMAIAALAFHGLIPLGYMPDFTHAARAPFAMTICGGMQAANTATHDDRMPDKGNQKSQSRMPCPFSVNAVFASGGDAAAVAIPVCILVILITFTVFAFVSERRFGNASPRAPPLFS